MEQATTAALPAGQLAALDQAVAAYREACEAFVNMTGKPGAMREAETELRRAGYDAATRTITLPVAAVHFTDVRADGARMLGVSGSILGEVWVLWGNLPRPRLIEDRTYDAYDLIQVRA
jgi:hypothetical protein